MFTKSGFTRQNCLNSALWQYSRCRELQKEGIDMKSSLKVFMCLVFASISLTAVPASAEEGLALAKKSGCLNCHSVDKAVVGPAWMDVSKKYKGVKAMSATLTGGKVMKGAPKKVLVAKVKKGGKGNWAEVAHGAAMPANSPKVSDADITKLVTFILGLAK